MKFQPNMRRVLVSLIIVLFLLNMLAPVIPHVAGAALPLPRTADHAMKTILGPTESASSSSHAQSVGNGFRGLPGKRPTTLLAYGASGTVHPAGAGDDPWFDPNWQYRKSVTIDHTKVSADLTNFPVLISIATDSDLASKAKANGYDIVFTDSSGSTRLSHEIESYTSPTGHLVAWVNVPSLSSTSDTVLYMYYGNPSASDQQDTTRVWDSHFKMVHHLNEASGTHQDSTSNGNNAVPDGGVSQGVAGKIDGADGFDGINDHIEVSDSNSLDLRYGATLQAWIDPLSSRWSTAREIVVSNAGSTLTVYQIFMNVTYDSRMRPDFSDLRFVDSIGNVLSYWIQSYSPANYANTWVKVPEIPGGSVETIWMYYGNASAESGSSADGTFEFFDDFSYVGHTYVENPTCPLQRPTGSGWEASIVNCPSVIFDNGTYYFYYIGCSTGDQWSSCQIGVATSKDGLNFVRHPDNPIISRVDGTWEHSVMTPAIIKVGDTFYLIYMAADPSHRMKFGLATSRDGVHFTKDPDNPVFSDDSPWVHGTSIEKPALSYFGGTFYLYYGNAPFGLPRGIGVATSTDAKHWTTDPHNPIVAAGDGGSWTNACTITPQVFKDGNDYVMFIAGSDVCGSPPDLKLGILRSPNPNFYPKSSVVWDVNNPQYSAPWGVDCPGPIRTTSEDNNTVLYQDNWDAYYTNVGNNYLANAMPGNVIDPHKWIIKKGSWGVTDAKALQNYGESNDHALLISSYNVSDSIHIRAKARPKDNNDELDASIIFRYRDGTFYSVDFRAGTSNDARVFFYDGSSWNQIGPTIEDLSYRDSVSDYDILEASMNGYTITGWLNGNQVIQVTDDTHYSSAGNAGLGSYESDTSQVVFDDLQIRKSFDVSSTPLITFGSDLQATGSLGGIIEKGNAYSFTLLNGTLNGLVNEKNVSIPVDNAWQHIALTYDSVSGSMKLYVNGHLESERTLGSEIQTNSNNLIIGDSISFSGTVDELRVSDIARSGEWVSTEYTNENDPAGFYNFGTEETNPQPVISDENPQQGTVNVPLSLSQLTFTLTDYQGDKMDYYVATSPDIGSVSASEVGNGIYSISVDGLKYDTTYKWTVNVTDRTYWTNETYYFKTEENFPPVVTNLSPSDGAVDVPVSLSVLSFDLTDANGNLMNYTVTASPNIGSGSGNNVGNGRQSISVSGLQYFTDYAWHVAVSDGSSWTNKTYRFTTEPKTIFNPLVEGWQFGKKITIDHTKVDGDLANFPVLIDITDPDLASKAKANGFDILFMNGSGVARKLNHEIESYNAANGHLVAWVNVPNLSSTSDTAIYMYYGNPTASNQMNRSAVWDHNYRMVQHLDETSGTHYDSTEYGNNGTTRNGVTQGAVGKIDGADSFDGTDDYIDCGNHGSLDGSGELTLEAWVKPNTVTPSYHVQGIIYKRMIPPDPATEQSNYGLALYDNQVIFTFYNGEWRVHSTTTANLEPSKWYYVVASYNETNNRIRIYLNGALLVDETETSRMITNNQPVVIGHARVPNYYFNGGIDEARISSLARGSSWIKTSYNNQADPRSFYNVGEEISNAPSVSNPSPSDGAANVPVSLSVLSFDLTDANGDLMDFAVTTSPNIGSGSGNNVGDGRQSISVGSLECGKTYLWQVNVTDGSTWTKKTYQFNTKACVLFDPFEMGWEYRKNITIDHRKVISDLVNFPVLIDITDPDLASHAQSNGNDIVFTDYFRNMKLNHEIELYDGTTGHLVAWVNSNVSLTTDTIIWMYYGNPAAVNQQNRIGVWDKNYVMIYHLSEQSGNANDSTQYGNNGTPSGDITRRTSGRIGYSYSFGGTNSYVNVNNNLLNLPNNFTMEAWIKISDKTRDHIILSWGENAQGKRRSIWVGMNTGYVHFSGYMANVMSSTNVADGNWHYIVITMDANRVTKVYSDGVVVASGTPSLNPYTYGGTRTGANPIGTENAKGVIDEVRISNGARISSWIAAEYQNQNNPSGFYSIGTQEQNPALAKKRLAIGYAVLGGGSPTQPTLHYTLNSNPQTILVPLSPGATNVQADPGSTYWIGPNPLTGSGSNERWYSNEGCDSAGGACPVNNDVTLTYHYKHQWQVSFVASPSPGGTTSPAGTAWYDDTSISGTPISISATPNTGYTFSSWTATTTSGTITFGSSSSASTTVTIRGTGTVTATFTQNEYTLTVTTFGSGSVSKVPVKTSYNYGDSVELTANPVAGWSFSAWGGDISGSVSPRSIIINGTTSVTATFTINVYHIAASAGSGGSISPLGSVAVDYGADQGFTIAANTHYHVLDVLVDGESVGSVSSYTFTFVTADHTIAASFLLNAPVVTVTGAYHGARLEWTSVGVVGYDIYYNTVNNPDTATQHATVVPGLLYDVKNLPVGTWGKTCYFWVAPTGSDKASWGSGSDKVWVYKIEITDVTVISSVPGYIELAIHFQSRYLEGPVTVQLEIGEYLGPGTVGSIPNRPMTISAIGPSAPFAFMQSGQFTFGSTNSEFASGKSYKAWVFLWNQLPSESGYWEAYAAKKELIPITIP